MTIELGFGHLVGLVVFLVLIAGTIVLTHWVIDNRWWSARTRTISRLSQILESVENFLEETRHLAMVIAEEIPVASSVDGHLASLKLVKLREQLTKLANNQLLQPHELVRLVTFDNETLRVELVSASILEQDCTVLYQQAQLIEQSLDGEPPNVYPPDK